MTTNRYPVHREPTSKHDRYVRAINAALQDGNDTVAEELAVAYREDADLGDTLHLASRYADLKAA